MILTNEFIQGLDQYIKANYDIYSHIEIQVVTVQEKSTPSVHLPAISLCRRSRKEKRLMLSCI